MDNISLGLFLKNARTSKGYSLRYLSSISNITFQHISLIENDKYIPTLSTLKRLCSALGLDYKTVIKRFYCIKESDSDMETLSLGAFLKNTRLLKGFTLQQLSDLAWTSSSHIYNIECDNVKPSLSVLRSICFALELDCDKLSKKYL